MKIKLFKSSAGVFSLRVISILFGLVVSYLLTQFLGTKEYGIYIYIVTWVGFLGIPALFGFDRLLVREVSVYKTKTNWGMLRGIIRFSNSFVFLLSLALASIIFLMTFFVPAWSSSELMTPLRIAVVLLPIFSLTIIRQSILRGLNKVVIGQLPETLIRPLMIIGLLLGYYFFVEAVFPASTALILLIIGALIAFVFGTILMNRKIPTEAKKVKPVYDKKIWLKSAFPLLLLGSASLIMTHTDIIMLGAIKAPSDAGIYNIANSFARFVGFVLMAVNAALAPIVASKYAEKKFDDLQRLITRSTRLIVSFSLPVAVILVLFGSFFLGIFGSDFKEGLSALRILCIGQLINTLVGSVALLLNMTGHERLSVKGVGIGAGLNIVLNFLLIPIWGVSGAAIATATSMIVWNVILAIYVKRKLSINSTIFNLIRYRSNNV